MTSSFPNVKNNHLRGDFYFRDVFQRNTYASFTGPSFSDNSTLYINQNDQAINCTSQVSTYDNGVGSLHVFTRNNAEFNKANTATATVSLNLANTTFRSAHTNVQGGFTVGANYLLVNNGNVGIQTATPQHALDVTGDCNVDAESAYRINSVPVLWQTVSGVTGNVRILEVRDLHVTGTASLPSLVSTVIYESSTPFIYTGPGPSANIGVPFYSKTGNATFMVASGSNNNVFTFTTTGTYMLQAEIQTGYPWFPEGEVFTYYLKNDLPGKYGMESHPGSSAFRCTRPYMMAFSANDTVRFIIDSATENEYDAGIDSCRITIVKF